MREYDDKGLVKLLRLGNKQAFEKIYERYHRQLYFMARKYLKDRGLAEDAVQDIFVKLWNKRDSLDPSQSVKGLLFTSLKNHVLNMIRDRKNKILSGYELGEESHPRKNHTGDDVIYTEYQHIVKRGLAELPEKKRKVFELRAFNGLSNPEIAKILLISINTVKVHYYHGSRFMRSYLEKHADIH